MVRLGHLAGLMLLLGVLGTVGCATTPPPPKASLAQWIELEDETEAIDLEAEKAASQKRLLDLYRELAPSAAVPSGTGDPGALWSARYGRDPIAMLRSVADAEAAEAEAVAKLEGAAPEPELHEYDFVLSTSDPNEVALNLREALDQRLQEVADRVKETAEVPDVEVELTTTESFDATVPRKIGADHVSIGADLAVNAHNDDELACLVAHEVAHLTEGHASRGAAANIGRHAVSGLVSLAVGAAIVYGSQGMLLTPDTMMFAAKLGQVTSRTLLGPVRGPGGFSEEDEREADRVALETVHKAGYDPRACSRYVMRLRALHRASMREGGEGVEWVRADAKAADRVLELRRVAGDLTSSEWSLGLKREPTVPTSVSLEAADLGPLPDVPILDRSLQHSLPPPPVGAGPPEEGEATY